MTNAWSVPFAESALVTDLYAFHRVDQTEIWGLSVGVAREILVARIVGPVEHVLGKMAL